MTLIKKRKGHYLTNKSLLISNLQKTVRRSLVNQALKTALTLIEYHTIVFLRRLPIILLEDTILHPQLDFIIYLMVRISKEKRAMTIQETNVVLSIIRDITEVKERDMIDPLITGMFARMEFDKKLSTETSNLINAIRTRVQYGGKSWDMELLDEYANMWRVRFKDEAHWWNLLSKFYPQTKIIDARTIRKLKKEDVLLESVDFHCSPIIKILLKKESVISHTYRIFGRGITIKDIIEELIWHLRSNQNPRKVFYDKTIPVDSINLYYSLEDIEKFVKLYFLIEKDINGISKWWIEKMHKQESNHIRV